LFCLLACFAQAQPSVQIATEDTVVRLQANDEAPQTLGVRNPGSVEWVNDAGEKSVDFVEVDGKHTPVSWRFNAAESMITQRDVAFVYESQSPRLRLTWRWTARVPFGPIEHNIQIENLSSHELWLPLQDSFQYNFHVDPNARLTHVYIEKGADTPSAIGTHEVKAASGSSWAGFSSTYAHRHDDEAREIIPWSLLQRDDLGESGWYVGIEFSGRTRISLLRDQKGVRGAVGLNPEPGPFRTRLTPNEKFTTPTVFVGAFRHGIDGAGNSLRRWVREVLGNPETWSNPKYPLMVNNSWGSGMAVNETLALRMIDDSAELGLEMFHIDAGWFRSVGDWYPDPKKFPHGLAPIADAAHRHGLKFGIWVDWTQAGASTAPGALNARDPKVRDWLVTELPSDWKPEEFKGETTDIGYPPAKQWAQEQLERMVRDFKLDMLEHDGYLVAQGCVQKDHPHAPPDPANPSIYSDSGFRFVRGSNSTDVSYHSTRAYYDIYTRLRQNHPGLLLEVCNDGGRMVDFGSAAHADYFSITDTYDPLSNRRAFYDTSHVLPPAMLESYVEKWPTPKIENFRYMLRSGMMGWVSIMQDTNAWTDEQRRVAKEEIKLYKSALRMLIRDADLYHISPRPDGKHWDGIEYFDSASGRGVVYAFRGSTPHEISHRFILRGLRSNASYRVRCHDHTFPDRTISGRDLMARGLLVSLTIPYSSELVFIEQQ
jgi:hypothetical protein